MNENQPQKRPPSPRELVAQKVKLEREQESLLRDLLQVLDALDHACAHWQDAEQTHMQEIALKAQSLRTKRRKPSTPSGQMQKLLCICLNKLKSWLGIKTRAAVKVPSYEQVSSPDTAMADVLTSGREGIELIRRTLLDVLNQRQVTPINSEIGQPFDPGCMYALGQQESDEIAENMVLQEVTRGYTWKNRILREAQVIVAARTGKG
ncbi:MAG: nucleotide exchange factor GrpE [Cyanothece sp. SIO1E1]|nr:nucleotide exchange factor GrpE [Cyanothece sp. SIO1E1]